MSSQLSKLVERIKTWPKARQADVVRVIEAMEGAGTGIYKLSSEERRAIQASLDSNLVSDANVEAFRNRHKA
ncbi:hypothetical protein A3A38_01635 [Candidatus Kaiserbacteria bacterium RIFCSPLOWO2_01_FULL_53_17]|uniref:Uncharacterized protein n=1 Tax=Candidatus Kaiserbacteria bacterium RIFCSPLOWO2_01_FULL_53_17 TaxID=1798511 RepID=A0A1F6EGX6_9BACT|nr:MAG: hypothetical protein A3A38_01635 [Candidatus Kaiserbacteria bacterium RIFCSPLOWO2_01_FULL_53_17]